MEFWLHGAAKKASPVQHQFSESKLTWATGSWSVRSLHGHAALQIHKLSILSVGCSILPPSQQIYPGETLGQCIPWNDSLWTQFGPVPYFQQDMDTSSTGRQKLRLKISQCSHYRRSWLCLCTFLFCACVHACVIHIGVCVTHMHKCIHTYRETQTQIRGYICLDDCSYVYSL